MNAYGYSTGSAPFFTALEVVVLGEVDGSGCVVELVDQQDVRPHALHDLGNLTSLRIVRGSRGRPRARPPPSG